MFGALIGDMAGSRFEWSRLTSDPWNFELLTGECHPTDDSMMTIAVARALRLADGDPDRLAEACCDAMHEIGNRYPRAGYGGTFIRWLALRSREPYGSFGNGSAMRVSPVGWAYATLEETKKAAAITASVTHNHPFGIAGACATAQAIFMARTGSSKEEIRSAVAAEYDYNLNRTLAEIQPGYSFDVTCQGSVPEALIAFLESTSYEDAIRKAIWLGGDADTQAAIAGSVAEAFYGGVPEDRKTWALARLDDYLREEVRLWQEWLAKRTAAQQ